MSIEGRDRYDVDHEREEFAAFLRGKELPPRTAETNAWLGLVAATTEAGRLIERIRIVTEPLTEYTRFEFAAYRDNIAAGEKIRIIPRRVLADADQGWASEDFWIFDEEIVVLLCYDEEGRFLAAHQPKDVATYLRAQQRALSIAIDFDDFVTESGPRREPPASLTAHSETLNAGSRMLVRPRMQAGRKLADRSRALLLHA